MNHSCKTDLQKLLEDRPMACAVEASLKELGYLKTGIILCIHILPEHETSGLVIPSPDLRSEVLITFLMYGVYQ
jgi:hypothetical protein